MLSMSEPNIWIPIGRSYSKISSFCRLFAASRISPSDEINSVYIISTPFCLHTKRKGGSLTSSIGANNNGNSPKSIFPILTDIPYLSTSFYLKAFNGTKLRKTPRYIYHLSAVAGRGRSLCVFYPVGDHWFYAIWPFFYEGIKWGG